MMVETGSAMRVSKRRSRPVTMPTSRPFSVTGTPEMLCAWVSFITSPMLVPGPTVMGLRMIPLS